MRIISGNLKGRKISLPKNKHTRPLKDLTKESIFNILEHSNLLKVRLNKSKILDLFSGVGSFGLECVSRGAKSIVFIENFPEALKILKKNINDLGCEKKVKVFYQNIFNINKYSNLLKEKFEIIFLDPPYKEKNIDSLIDKIICLKLLKKEGIIIIHRHKNENDVYPENFKILKIKKYGISKIIFGSVT